MYKGSFITLPRHFYHPSAIAVFALKRQRHHRGGRRPGRRQRRRLELVAEGDCGVDVEIEKEKVAMAKEGRLRLGRKGRRGGAVVACGAAGWVDIRLIVIIGLDE